MLRSINSLKGYKLLATDGDIGTVKDVYFDDVVWATQYLVVDTGRWLSDRRVLIPRLMLGEPNWEARMIPVNMTKEAIEKSPPMSAHEPVSRQHETELHRYLDIEAYWMRLPGGARPIAVPPPKVSERESSHEETYDPHLRSCGEVTGYHIEANNGDIGHVEDFLVDDESWLIRYLVVDTRNWLPGRRVLVGATWLRSVSWEDAKVFVALDRDEIRESPRYHPSQPVGKAYEDALMTHYGGMARWM